MPKRTNDFQQIIYLIQRQLAADTVVTQSKMLKDRRTGDDVEVDIVIDAVVGGTTLTIGVECTARTRPADAGWVREMIGKHQDLPVNKTILVSQSGYTSGARRKAEAHGVEALTLKEAENLDWADSIRNLEKLMLGAFAFRAHGSIVEYLDPSPPPDEATKLSGDSLLQWGTQQNRYALEDFCNRVVQRDRVALQVMRKWVDIPSAERKSEFEFTVGIEAPGDSLILTSQNNWRRVKRLVIKAAARVLTTPLALRASRLRQARVAHGTAENIFAGTKEPDENVIVTLTKEGNELAGGSLLIPCFRGRSHFISDMRLGPRPGKDESEP